MTGGSDGAAADEARARADCAESDRQDMAAAATPATRRGWRAERWRDGMAVRWRGMANDWVVGSWAGEKSGERERGEGRAVEVAGSMPIMR